MSEEPGDELADRVTALEEQQRSDRRAIGSLDADIADLQVQRRQDVRLIQAVRNTQVEHGQRLDRIDRRLDGMVGRFDGIDRRLDRMDGRFDRMDGRFDRMDGRFDGMDGRLDPLESGFADMRSKLTLIVELLRRDAG
jgi:uncharacterized coiled-coil protein SlyX